VNTLTLVGTDDDVLDGRSTLKDEHGIRLSSLGLLLASACYSTLSLVHRQ
jgi:hypothetical protein